MPEIPTYLPQEQKTVSPEPYLPANATPEMFGAEKARQITSVISSGVSIVANVMDDINKRQEADRIKLAKARARDELTRSQRQIDDMLFGDNGFYTRKGEQVENIIEDFQKQSEKIRRESMGRLHDDYSKEMFGPSYDDFITRNLRSLSQHRADQIDKYNMNTLNAQRAQDHDNAVKNRYNKDNLDAKTKEIVINTLSMYAGMGEEVQTQAVNDALNLLHKDVILGYMNDREFDMARDYITKNSDEIDEVVKKGFLDILKKEDDNFYVSEKAEELSKSGKTLDEQLEIADRETNPYRKDNLRREIEQRFDLKNKINDYRQTQTGIDEFNKLFQMMDSGDIEGIEQYRPPTGAVKPNVNEALRKLRYEAIKGVFDPKAKDHTLAYWKFRAMPNVDKGKLSFDQIMGYSDKVNDKEFKEIFDEWEKIRNAPDKVKNIQTPHEFFEDSIRGLDDFTVTKNMNDSKVKETRKRVQQFFTQADKYYQVVPEDKKNDMDTWNKISSFLLRKVYPEGNTWWRDKLIYRFELPYQDIVPDPKIFMQKENLPPKIKAFVDDQMPVTNKYNDNLDLFIYEVDRGGGIVEIYDEAGSLINRNTTVAPIGGLPYGR